MFSSVFWLTKNVSSEPVLVVSNCTKAVAYTNRRKCDAFCVHFPVPHDMGVLRVVVFRALSERLKIFFRIRIVFAYLLIGCGLSGNANTLTRVIHTRYGKLQGLVKQAGSAKHLRPVEVFLGVPYATPPTGVNRFSPTRALTPWDDVRLFDKFGPVCPQWLPDLSNETAALETMPKGRLQHLKRLLPYLRNQSEDCLYLNIFAPASDNRLESERSHPVIVYFHGESYSWNSGNLYDGKVLASYTDSIVITINYRLGILGFLNMNSEPYQKARVANYGLMDQIAALHWIQQNIIHFDGDPKNVTLMGHGTGAACVNFLMISPAVTPGLFHRAILLSGSALSNWALVEEPVVYSMEIARQTNCSSSDENFQNYEHIIDCLREVPLSALTNVKISAPMFLHAFGPSVDGVVIKSSFQEEILMLPELQSFAKGASMYRNSKPREPKSFINANKYDLLFGCVTSEALWRFRDEDIQSGFEGDRRDRILRTFIRNTYNYHLSEIFFTVVNEYTDWERTVLHPINTRDSTLAALSDAQFVAPLVQTGDLFSRTTTYSNNFNGNPLNSRSTKAFFYVFDYQTKDGDYPQRIGSVHGEDLPYIFGAPLSDSLAYFSSNFTKTEITLSEAFMLYIGNFAKFGNPNDYQKQDALLPISKERNRFRGVVWEEYDSVHQKYLEIGMKPKMKNHFRAHQLSVWLRLIPELHRAGMEDVTVRHNTFHSRENDLYDGIIKADKHGRNSSNRRSSSHNGTVAEIKQSVTTPEPVFTTCVNIPTAVNTAGVAVHANANPAMSATEPHSLVPYSTTLSLTIAIGCTLLILNVLIFAGVYYQRDKARMEIKSLREQQLQQRHRQPKDQSSDTAYDTKSRNYHSNSVMLDMETENNSKIFTRGLAPGRSIQRSYKFPSTMMSSPTRQTQTTNTHISKYDQTPNSNTFPSSCDDSFCLKSATNGSILMMNPTALPSTPSPSNHPSLDEQSLMHSGLTINVVQPYQKCSILKVPAAAINEMRI